MVEGSLGANVDQLGTTHEKWYVPTYGKVLLSVRKKVSRNDFYHHHLSQFMFIHIKYAVPDFIVFPQILFLPTIHVRSQEMTPSFRHAPVL